MALGRRAFLTALVGGGLAAGGCGSRRRTPPVDELIDLIARSSQKNILDGVGAAVRRGATLDALLQAAFLAPIVTGGDGEDVHAMLVVPSIRSHCTGWLPTLWAVCNAQLWCRPARAPVAEGSLDAAALRREGSRRRADPHAAIYAAQATRMLEQLDRRHHPAVLRSLARYLDRTGPAEPDPPVLRLNEADATPPFEIADALRKNPGVSLDGFSTRALWEALAQIAIDTRIADDTPSGAGVHQTTLLDALCLLHDRAPPAERALHLARAVPAVLALRAPPATPSARSHTASVEALRAELRDKGSGEHDFKYFAAVESIAPRLSATTRAKWWAAASLAHPFGSGERWHRADEALALVARL